MSMQIVKHEHFVHQIKNLVEAQEKNFNICPGWAVTEEVDQFTPLWGNSADYGHSLSSGIRDLDFERVLFRYP